MLPDKLVTEIDLKAVERRIFGIPVDPLTELALRLPKKHPLRFAMLYSAGPTTLQRMATKMLTDEMLYGEYKLPLQAIRLEAELMVFENWQAGATADALLRRRRENAAIAYAAAEAGLISSDTAMKAVRAVNHLRPESPAQVTTSPSGRLPQGPPVFHWSPPVKEGYRVQGAITGRWVNKAVQHDRWQPGQEHPYPEDGILRD
jgi:hypothetical protein